MKLRTIVYKFTFPDGYVYIGSTCDTQTRWAKDGEKYTTPKIADAIRRFGWENIKKEIVLQLEPTVENQTQVLNVERELIRAYDGRSYNTMGSSEYAEKVGNFRRSLPKKQWCIDGVSRPVSEWCAEYGKSLAAIQKRMSDHGLTLKQALTFPNVPIEMRRHALEYWHSIGCL